MAKKISMYSTKSQTISNVFDEFVRSRTADGVSAVTVKTYRAHFHSISLHMDMERPLEVLTKRDLENMIVSMKEAGLAHNSIFSYARVFRSFLNWCKQEHKSTLEMPHIVDKEVVKKT